MTERPIDQLNRLLQTFDANPKRVRWLYMRAATEHFGGNVSKTARSLKIGRRSLQRVLTERWRD